MALRPTFERGEIRLSDAAICKLTHDERMSIIISHISHEATDGEPVITRHSLAGIDWVVVTVADRSTTRLLSKIEHK